jgi:hypothetical protein
VNESTLPTSTRAHNKELDAEIMRREPAGDLTRDAAWWQRRHRATLWTTVRAWFMPQ